MWAIAHLTPLRLNFCSLVLVKNWPKSTAPRLTPLTLLETLTSYSTNTSPFLTRSHLSPNLAITISVSFAVFVHTAIPKQLPTSPHPLFTPNLTTATLSQPPQVLDHPAPTNLELSCTCCCQSSQIQSHHSHPSVSALAKNNGVHWIQAPFTLLL